MNLKRVLQGSSGQIQTSFVRLILLPRKALFLFRGDNMKTYSTEELKELTRISSEKKKNILMNWADNEVALRFYFKKGHPSQTGDNLFKAGKLKYFTRYDYIVQFDGQDTISILAKHAVLWIDRV